MSGKRNEYLDISEEEDESAQDSDIGDDSRLKRLDGSSTKRRKLNDGKAEVVSDLDSEQDEASAGSSEIKVLARSQGIERPNQSDDRFAVDEDRFGAAAKTPSSSNPKLKPISAAKLATKENEKHKTGVIYLSRIPPFMKPATLRQLLSPYGTILRIFLTPETAPAYTKRVKAGGNKKRSLFIDGWVEFASKKRAKTCAETLNGNILGGKKRGWYHDDIWNIKYLNKFKWDDLMAQVQEEERARESRLRAEINQESRERKAFLENLDRAKQERGMEKKRKQKSHSQDLSSKKQVPDGNHRLDHSFRQNKVKERDKSSPTGHNDDVKRVLSKIF